MRNIWIVVADAGRARIFSKRDGIDSLAVVQELDNPAGRAHASELVTDRPGRVEKHGSDVRSAALPPTDRLGHQTREFAHRLNHLLDAAADRGDFEMVALVAPAHFLGLLRSGMKPSMKERLVWHRANDLTHLGLTELEHDLGQALRFPYTAVTP